MQPDKEHRFRQRRTESEWAAIICLQEPVINQTFFNYCLLPVNPHGPTKVVVCTGDGWAMITTGRRALGNKVLHSVFLVSVVHHKEESDSKRGGLQCQLPSLSNQSCWMYPVNNRNEKRKEIEHRLHLRARQEKKKQHIIAFWIGLCAFTAI